MSGASSSGVEWSSLLEPVRLPEDVFRRPDDPRLGEVIEVWHGDAPALQPGRAVLIGFPQDEGVRRNHGRPGAAEAPREIRRHLGRLTPWDGSRDIALDRCPPLDAGNVRIAGGLEASQQALAEVVAGVLRAGAVPIVLGGGHETAYGHYLGQAAAVWPVGVINIDAHLDVRPPMDGHGHSGSPFRQMMLDAPKPLAGRHYACLGAQPQSVSHAHLHFVRAGGGVVHWADELTEATLSQEHERLVAEGCRRIYITIDADAITAATVPGVSAPNPAGLSGAMVLRWARQAGRSPLVAGVDLVEICPPFDRDGQSARWAALVVWHFLVGLAERKQS